MSQYKSVLHDTVERHTTTSPAAQLLGYRLLEVDHARGTIKIEFQAKPEFVNPIGILHGGFLAAMLDETLGGAVMATLKGEQFAPTIELKVNFIRSAQVGTLVAEGRVLHRGLSVVFLQGELRTVDGLLIATASATAQIQRIRKINT